MKKYRKCPALEKSEPVCVTEVNPNDDVLLHLLAILKDDAVGKWLVVKPEISLMKKCWRVASNFSTL